MNSKNIKDRGLVRLDTRIFADQKKWLNEMMRGSDIKQAILVREALDDYIKKKQKEKKK